MARSPSDPTRTTCPRCGVSWNVASGESLEYCPACAASSETQVWQTGDSGGSAGDEISEAHNLIEALAVEFEIIERLGQGGLGVVYRARPRKAPQTDVALKVLRESFSEDDLALRRFLREIVICEKLAHPRIVRSLGHGAYHGQPYLVLEYCNEGNLETLYARRPDLPALKWLRFMEKTLQGVEFAHSQGLVHRDLKPENVLLHRGPDRRVRPKIADFGLSKAVAMHGSSRMTSSGSFAGTLYYMPREQLLDFRNLSPAADVWSLGAMLFRFLTRQHARPIGHGVDALQVVMHDEPARLGDVAPHLPRRLAEVVDRALATDPTRRYPDAGALRAELVEAMRDMA